VNSRTKGHDFERHMAETLREVWPECYTTRFKGSLWLDHCGVDLINTGPFNVQCKAVEKLSPGYHEILSRMPQGKNTNIIIHKRNRKATVVVMRLDDFMKLIKQVETMEAPSLEALPRVSI